MKLVKCFFMHFFAALLSISYFCNADKSNGAGLQVKCGEANMEITVSRFYLEDRRVPFRPEYLRLGVNSTQPSSCGPKDQLSETELVLSAGLHQCGTTSSVHGDWLVYSNSLVLFPAVVQSSTGSLLVRGATTVIPVECHYKRKQMVHGEPVSPTWLPMTSTVSAFGLLRFTLRAVGDDCSSSRRSSTYNQGETVFLEAGLETSLHPSLYLYVDYCVATLKSDPLSTPSYKFISDGCLVDSMLPGSSSRFFPRTQRNRICFSVQAFQFSKDSINQMFISCHLRASLTRSPSSHRDKACFFHKPTFTSGFQTLYHGGGQQRETMFRVSAAASVTLAQKTSITLFLDMDLNQIQKGGRRQTQQLVLFTSGHGPTGPGVCR